MAFGQVPKTSYNGRRPTYAIASENPTSHASPENISLIFVNTKETFARRKLCFVDV